MKITPIINTNFLVLKQAKNKASNYSAVTFGKTKSSELSGLPVYYYNNIKYPNEKRIYSSHNKELLERPADFALNQLEDIPCPACGRKMITRQKFQEFLTKLNSIPSQDYLDLLEEYKEYMRPVELSAFEEIKELSNNTGETDIRALIENLRDNKIPLLQEIQMNKLKQMRRLAKSLPESERNVILPKLDRLQGYIRNKKTEAPFRRKIMIDRISKYKIKNPHKYKKFQNIARSFPTSSDVNSAWIVKYSGNDKNGNPWNSYDIAKRMLEFSVPNTDHIISRDIEEHHDDIFNYMGMHSGCNGSKSNKSILHWFNEDKKLRQQSLTAYFKRVQELISTGEVKDKRYAEYVANATTLLKEASSGQIDINV